MFFLEYKKGNIVLTFSAAAFEEFRAIAKNILLSSGLNINQTNTADLKGVTVSESLEVKNGREKIFAINFYNSTSRVLLNGNHVHISEFVSTHLRDILQTLDHNKNFEQVNAKIREYCQSFLDIGKQEEESKNSDNCKCPTPLLSVRNSDISGQDVDNVDTDTCPICLLVCDINSKAAQCDSCFRWSHYTCEKLTLEKIKEIESNNKAQYICKSCQLMKNEHRSPSQPTHNVIAIESMNLGNIAESKHHSDKVNMEVTTDHPNLSQSVPTDDNLDNLNGNDSGMTSPVVVESISTQSSLMLMMSRKTKRHQPQESASTNTINGPDTKTSTSGISKY